MPAPNKRPSLLALIRALRLTDACLLLFMIVLMGQTVFHLLMSGGTPMTETFGTVVRTTKAAIFGYFIGSGFLTRAAPSQSSATPPVQQIQAPTLSTKAPKNQIGFQAEPSPKTTPPPPVTPPTSSATSKRQLQQILIVTSIGLYSLILLIIAQYSETASASVATLSQLRDFLSGSVGLLIGHSSNEH